jgi:hypothetical protein
MHENAQNRKLQNMLLSIQNTTVLYFHSWHTYEHTCTNQKCVFRFDIFLKFKFGLYSFWLRHKVICYVVTNVSGEPPPVPMCSSPTSTHTAECNLLGYGMAQSGTWL